MWLVRVTCSSCAEEAEIPVAELDDVEREVCRCGYSFVVLAVAELEPVEVKGAEVVELPRRRRLASAA